MKNILGISLLLTLLNPMTALAFEEGCTNDGDPVAMESVRSLRQTFNQAIAEKDIKAIKDVLHENVLLITGTDSDLYTGVNAQLAIWRDDFAKADRAVYVRAPQCIRVSPVAPVALEYGTWRGERAISTGDYAAGSYAAKWRHENGRWYLESEIFSTEACGGGFCPVKVKGE
jgi:ketosteroid isomerase-like protein